MWRACLSCLTPNHNDRLLTCSTFAVPSPPIPNLFKVLTPLIAASHSNRLSHKLCYQLTHLPVCWQQCSWALSPSRLLWNLSLSWFLAIKLPFAEPCLPRLVFSALCWAFLRLNPVSHHSADSWLCFCTLDYVLFSLSHTTRSTISQAFLSPSAQLIPRLSAAFLILFSTAKAIFFLLSQR